MPARRSALSQPLFRRYFPASCLNTLGSWVLRFLFGWGAWELTHSALWVGVVSGLMLLPSFVLTPIFGVISDRVNPRNGLLLTVSCQAFIAAIAAGAHFLGLFSLTWLLTLACLLGAASAAHQPMRLALVPRLVSREALPEAIGISAMVFNSSRILGPALGGWLLTHSSTGNAFLVATALLTAGLVPLLTVTISSRGGAPNDDSLAIQLRQGLRFASRHPGIRLLLIYTMIGGLVGRTALELLPALSGKILAGDARTLAILTALAGVGSVLGGLVLARYRGSESRLLRLVMLSLTSTALVLLPVFWADNLATLGALVLYLSMATTMTGIGCQALTQLTVPEAYRGRVLSFWAVVAMGTPALGALLLGAAADVVGFPLALTVCALLALAGIALLNPSYRRELSEADAGEANA